MLLLIFEPKILKLKLVGEVRFDKIMETAGQGSGEGLQT